MMVIRQLSGVRRLWGSFLFTWKVELNKGLVSHSNYRIEATWQLFLTGSLYTGELECIEYTRITPTQTHTHKSFSGPEQ